jgi:flagellar capping protein FliD
MQDTLDAGSSLKSAEDSYQNLTAKIEERLEKLDTREALITGKYMEQFGSMEQAMSQFNSTKSLLENLVESWNQK